MFPLTIPSLLRIMPRSAPVIASWIGELEQAMVSRGIDHGNRVPYFLANIAHESWQLTKLSESFNYKPDRLHAVFPSRVHSVEAAEALLAQGPEAVANALYGSREGNGPDEGYLYRARGPLGLTFKNNYHACSLAVCGDLTLEANPDLVSEPEMGSKAAAWFWEKNGCNEAADDEDFMNACALVNVGHRVSSEVSVNGYADRAQYLKLAIAEI